MGKIGWDAAHLGSQHHGDPQTKLPSSIVQPVTPPQIKSTGISFRLYEEMKTKLKLSLGWWNYFSFLKASMWSHTHIINKWKKKIGLYFCLHRNHIIVQNKTVNLSLGLNWDLLNWLLRIQMFENITDFLVSVTNNQKKFHCNLLLEILFLVFFVCLFWPNIKLAIVLYCF